MADIDPNLVGSVLNALPLDKMIYGPLDAMIKAQVRASKSFADFLMTVCIDDDGKARNVQFNYDETQVDEAGQFKGTISKTMRIPLLAAITLPNICIDKGTIDFELTISQSCETHSETSAQGGFEAKIGWGPFSVSVHGSVSHKSKQTRKTDTRAKYTIHVEASRHDPPEAVIRVMEFLTNAATKPTQLPSSKLVNDEGKFKSSVDDPKASGSAGAASGKKRKP